MQTNNSNTKELTQTENTNIFIRPVLRDTLFTAYRPLDFKTRTFVPVTIVKSIAILYRVEVHGGTENYVPVNYRSSQILNAISELFLGAPTDSTIITLLNVKVRSGWMDKSLSNLRFCPIIDLYNKFVSDQLDRSEQQKLRQVLAAITMSKRDMVKCYNLPTPKGYSWSVPIVRLDRDFKPVAQPNQFNVTAAPMETQNESPI